MTDAPSPDSPNSPASSMRFYSACELPTEYGTFQLNVYRDAAEEEHMLLTYGDLQAAAAPFVRIHSECFTGEVLGSMKCDCREQLERAMKSIVEEGCGAIAYLRQEGRGIGLGNKVRAYAEQEKGADTIEANERLGLPVDAREFGIAAEMLRMQGLTRVRLNTNNPNKINSLREQGIVVEDVVPSQSAINPHNEGYLQTKYERLGHQGLRNGSNGRHRA